MKYWASVLGRAGCVCPWTPAKVYGAVYLCQRGLVTEGWVCLQSALRAVLSASMLGLCLAHECAVSRMHLQARCYSHRRGTDKKSRRQQ